MSVRALTIVFDSPVGCSTLKSVLVTLADRMDDATGLCFPSIADTVARTELDRKTVLAKMDLLRDEKIITDTGHRVGRTKQIPVWFVDLARLAEFSSAVKESQKRNSSENGTGTVFAGEESRFSAETVPKTGHGTTTGTVIEPPPAVACGGGGAGIQDLAALVDAAVWHHKSTGGTLRNETGFRRAVAARITQQGASPEDIDILARHRKATAKAATPAVEPTPIKLDPAAMAAGAKMLESARHARLAREAATGGAA